MIKISFLIILVIMLLGFISNNNFAQAMKVTKLTLNSMDILQIIIDPLLNDNQENYDLDKTVCVLNSISKNDSLEFRVGLLYKDDFNWYLDDKKDSLFGCFEYKNITILVFGFPSEKYFRPEKDTLELEFLKKDAFLSNDKQDLNPPPIFEPEIRVFRSCKNRLRFIEKGMFYLLK